MNMEEKSRDALRRAAARLGESLAARGPAAAPPNLANAPNLAKRPTAAFETSRVEPVLGSAASPATEPQADGAAAPAGKNVVTISPTTLAANGITLPGTGHSRAVEEFRIIKRHVLANAARTQSSASDGLNRMVMVTSAQPGDGKTYTAINLALSIALERDLKVLLFDADVYRQSLLSYLGVKAESGWIELLSDSGLSFSDVLIHTNIPNLTVMPAGHAHPEVPELMSSRKMVELVTEMARRYSDRFIIFDTLPCLASSEPAVLASMVGQAVFVVAAYETGREQVETSLRLIGACPSVSLVLNKAYSALTEQFGGGPYGYRYKDKK
jgi:exopolysaccharide/PEP-CTERM locus tyrosine autokinase